ncbi:YceI family protein [Candidatus Poriferisocius sp.]|uniref:YceI family protein n=1 Tax=Candidatus Poriferisocius sp. TaxID=3101276 RepID=UPI003B5B4203
MLPAQRRRRILWVTLAVLVVVVVLAAVGIWWFTRDDAPPAVDLEAAASSIAGDDEDATPVTSEAPSEPTDAEPTDGEPAAAQPATDAPATTDPEEPVADPPDAQAPDGVSGVWTVDTSIGEFTYEDSTGTFIGFRVDEELAGIGATTAVGRTPEVSGSITIDGETVTAVRVEADMSAITTDDARRDRPVQGALNTREFPIAVFELTEPIDLGDDPASGEPVSATAVGELTVKGITRPVEVALQAQLVDDTVVVVGSTEVVFADYDVSVPRVPIVLSAEDHGTIEMQLFFTRTP